MSRATRRQYRVRFAKRGAFELTDATVDFILEIPPLAEVPVVAGSIVHPLTGGSEMRPLQIVAIDRDGDLIRSLTANGRWAALGRLVDLQYREDDPAAEWVTYGTGRCSAVDEADGPGRFRIEVSDESWVARRGRIFTQGGTTAIWPWGLLPPIVPSDLPVLPAGFAYGRWKGGYEPSAPADGEIVDTSGNLVRIRLTGRPGFYNGRRIPQSVVQWIRGDMLPEDELAVPGSSGGNWRHLRLRYPNTAGELMDWQIVSFGTLAAGTTDILGTLTNPDIINAGTASQVARIHVWIRAQSDTPADAGTGRLCAPTAPPDRVVPLHIGMTVPPGDPSPWGTDVSSHGFMHVADLTRRIWQMLGVRYDEQSLSELEQDTSLPVVAPRIDAMPDDPERWAQTELWAPLMLVALKDRHGRRRLKSLRPPPEGTDLSGVPILDASNSRDHRWRLVGHECCNVVRWSFRRLTHPAAGYPAGADPDLIPDPDALDGFLVSDAEIDPIQGDTVFAVGPRDRAFDAGATVIDPLLPSIPYESRAIESGLGQPLRGAVLQQHSEFVLQLYQDGPMRGTCEIAGSLAEQLEEGDYVLVDCADVGLANPKPEARASGLLCLVLSLTRHPAHAVIEYIVLRPEEISRCPDPDQPGTWLTTDPGEAANIRIRLSGLAHPGTDALEFRIRARKDVAGGQQVDLGLALYEGATEIAAWLEQDVSEDWVVYVFELTPEQIDAITDWDALAIEITRGGTTGGGAAQQRSLQISQITVG